ncbi:hypothetical protein BKA66DRAFT_431208 [Pyrenochaeta sp. MPI-SDFR-AT-0127]|nr:hypothetical protein BKA66DRAFT_431208 [Pyrenochaeta sp. MPI-SDFR-AT-0127]
MFDASELHVSSFSAFGRYTDGLPIHRPRNFTLISVLTLGSGYFIVKSRILADKQRERAAGDYSVSVDRSGTSTLKNYALLGGSFSYAHNVDIFHTPLHCHALLDDIPLAQDLVC